MCFFLIEKNSYLTLQIQYVTFCGAIDELKFISVELIQCYMGEKRFTEIIFESTLYIMSVFSLCGKTVIKCELYIYI